MPALKIIAFSHDGITIQFHVHLDHVKAFFIFIPSFYVTTQWHDALDEAHIDIYTTRVYIEIEESIRWCLMCLFILSPFFFFFISSYLFGLNCVAIYNWCTFVVATHFSVSNCLFFMQQITNPLINIKSNHRSNNLWKVHGWIVHSKFQMSLYSMFSINMHTVHSSVYITGFEWSWKHNQKLNMHGLSDL